MIYSLHKYNILNKNIRSGVLMAKKRDIKNFIFWCKQQNMSFIESFKMAKGTFDSINENEFFCLWEGRKTFKKNRMKIPVIITMMSLIVIMIILPNVVKPEIYGQTYYGNTGSVFEYPVQVKTAEPQFKKKYGKVEVKITPRANYTAGFRIVSAARYGGFSGEIAPLDLAGVWGGLLDKDLLSEISITQYNRFYFFKYTAEFPFGLDYIYRHSANMHIIPSTENIKNVIGRLGINDDIVIEGYLVDLRWETGSGEYHWNTSLSREDSGAGACEIIYVKKLIFNGSLYE